ncbi:MAG: hypothetical protein ACOYI8_07450 [Christensenellales bacterium]|jgi:hypothetical protein
MKRTVSAFIVGALILCALALSPMYAFAEDAPRTLPMDGTYIAVQNKDTFLVSVPTYTAIKCKVYGVLKFDEGVYSGMPAKDATGNYRYQIVYLNPGETILHLNTTYTITGVQKLAVVQVTPLSQINECEPDNDSIQTAPDLVPGRTVRGLGTIKNADYYRITVEKSSTLKFSVTLHNCWFNMFLTGSNGTSVAGYIEPKEPSLNKSRRTTRTFSVMPGVYYLYVPAPRYNPLTLMPSYGRYDVKMTVSKTKFKLNIKGPSTLSEGVCQHYEYTVKPSALDSQSLPVTYSLDQKSPVLEMDGSMLRGRQVGTAKLVLTLYGNRFTKKIKVVPNVYVRNRPKTGKMAAVYISHKSLRYKDGMVYAEVFVTNKTKFPLYGIGDIYGEVLDLKDDYSYCYMKLPDWVPEKPLRPGKSAVITFAYEQGVDGVPDFRTKRINALITEGNPYFMPFAGG